MIKDFPTNWILVLAVLLFSAVLITLAAFIETSVQGPLNVPADINFIAYIPGRYTIYRESIVDPKAKTNTDRNDSELNEMLLCWIKGCGHLSKLTPTIWNAVGMPYRHKEADTGNYLIGMPFAEFEILWPGTYDLHAEFSTAVDKHPNLTVGLKGLIVPAVLISILAQIIVLFIIIRKSPSFLKGSFFPGSDRGEL